VSCDEVSASPCLFFYLAPIVTGVSHFTFRALFPAVWIAALLDL